jgi:hypothetical protein
MADDTIRSAEIHWYEAHGLGRKEIKVKDDAARCDGLVRVIDESGEDYLYPKDYFVPVDLPISARRALPLT